MLQPSQIRKLAKGYSDRQLRRTNYGEIVTTGGWWGTPWIMFCEPAPSTMLHDTQPVSQRITDTLTDIYTAPTVQVWPTSISGLSEIGYAGQVLLKFENNHAEIKVWVDARYFSTILRKAKRHHKALTFHILQKPPHANGNTRDIFIVKTLGTASAMVSCITPASDRWAWRLTNNDIPRPFHHIPQPAEIILETASQPALM